MRQGVYRIIYEIQDSELIVLVVKVAHRKEVYKNN
ncbi:type II toxin-antitoxin system RelE family toxin [Candidatus Methylobacter oryzae]|nr:type II toxin-antitoxin system RelE/ParE family toxin [Candidatus Methylobacter oryzae]